MKKTETKTRKRHWHLMLGKMLEELLTPVGIEVYTEFPVMADHPRADILLLRKYDPEWTPEQLERLPDGIRHTKADHVLLEFKYSESVNMSAFRQAVGYDYFYKDSKELTDRQVRTFLVSSKTTRRVTLDKFSYSGTNIPGMYRSSNPMLEPIPLLVLNGLSDKPHNAYFKCFASQIQEKKAAFGTLKHRNVSSFSDKLSWLLNGLWRLWFGKGGDPMKQEPTPEEVIEMGRMLGDAYLSSLSPEQILNAVGKEEVLKVFRPEERLRGLRPEECMKLFKPEERLRGLGPEERLRGLRPEECMKLFKPEERLRGMSVKEIEAYLRKIRKKK